MLLKLLKEVKMKMLCNGMNYQALGNDLENGCPMSLLVCHVKKTCASQWFSVLSIGLKLKPSGSTQWHLHICSNKILRRDKNNNQSWRDWDCFYFAVDTEWKLKVPVLTIDAAHVFTNPWRSELGLCKLVGWIQML